MFCATITDVRHKQKKIFIQNNIKNFNTNGEWNKNCVYVCVWRENKENPKMKNKYKQSNKDNDDLFHTFIEISWNMMK